MPYFSRKLANGTYEIFNEDTGQIYGKYHIAKEANEMLLELRAAFALGIDYLGDIIKKTIDDTSKNHFNKYIKSLQSKNKGGSRKLYKKHIKKHKKTRKK